MRSKVKTLVFKEQIIQFFKKQLLLTLQVVLKLNPTEYY